MVSRNAPSPRSHVEHANVALLRGINVGGNKKVPMAALRELATSLGWQNVSTYIQSGNVVFAANGNPSALEDALERAIARQFKLEVPVLVRSTANWLEYAKKSPFAVAEVERPSCLHLALSKVTPKESAAETLRPFCTLGERVVIRRDAIWIDFVSGVGRSKLTPSVLDRAVGSTVTARNWNTVQQIAAML